MLKISQKRRKSIAAFLLINFLFSTALFAFPQKECDESCNIIAEVNNCCDMDEMTCCDMMESNNAYSSPTDEQIAESSCDYVIDTVEDFTFLVPKTIETSIELNEISYIILNDIEKTPPFFIKSQNTLLNSSPPIYITISSFLI